MATTVTRQPIGVEDISLDTAGHGGAAPNTFSRTTSSGGSQTIEKLSADKIPIRDAPIVTSARTPFAKITAADRDVEAVLADIRTNAREMKNFENYGGVPGIESSITVEIAKRNVAVWKKITEDIAAEGGNNGIYFPGKTYVFHEDATLGGLYATTTLPFTNDGMVISGTPSTTLIKHTSASKTFSFIVNSGGTRLTVTDLAIDNAAGQTAGASLDITTQASALSDIRIINSKFSRGLYGVRAADATSKAINGFWVSKCTFDDIQAGGWATSITGGISVNVDGCKMTGALGGGVLVDIGASTSMGPATITNNYLLQTGSSSRITVGTAGTMYSSKHKDFLVSGNRISNGDISMNKAHQYVLSNNWLFDGQIDVNLVNMIAVTDLQFLDNYMFAVATLAKNGIDITATGTKLDGFDIMGGKITGFDNHGIIMNFSGAVARTGGIHRVKVVDCSREDTTTTDYSSIRLQGGDATGGVQETLISNCNLRNFSVTSANSNKQKFGIEDDAAGTASKWIRADHNFIQGYGGLVSLGSTNSGAINTQDGGAAV